MSAPEFSPLGKPVGYSAAPTTRPAVLRSRAPPRAPSSASATSLPFVGVDIWNAYELSWLDERGKPRVALAEFRVPATSPNLIESKSFKLYLDSYAQHARSRHRHAARAAGPRPSRSRRRAGDGGAGHADLEAVPR